MKKIFKLTNPIWVFFFFCAATVLMTWPLSLHLKTAVIGGMGDNIYFVWLIHWYQRVLLEAQGHLLFNPWMNYPQGWDLSTTETTLADALPGVPFSYFLGPVAGYNIAILLTFVLAGFFMYLWMRDLTKSNWAGLLSGFLFTFTPYHLAHFVVGHLNLCGIQWFPLFFWGFHRLLNSNHKLELKFVLLTGLSLGLIAFTSMYYLYMTLLFAVIFGLAYVCFTRFKILRSKFFWLRLVSAGLISLPFLYFALKPFISLSNTGVLDSRSIEYAAVYSASPTDFFLPASDHFLFGQAVSNWFDHSLWNESSLYIGTIAIILACIVLIHNKKNVHRWLIWSALVVIFFSILLGLGINLHWNNQDVILKLPPVLQSMTGKDELPLYLPAAWLFKHLPFFDKMRTIMRFGFFAAFFTYILAGLGFTQIQASLPKKWKILFPLFVLILVLLDFYPGTYSASIIEPKPREVDIWLAKQPDDGAVVQMPFAESSDQAQVFYTLFHQKPILGGDFNANQPTQFEEISPVLEKFPEKTSADLLQSLGVKYVVVDESAYSTIPDFVQQMESFHLMLQTTLDGQSVYTFSTP
jgi:hypothetical protein